MRIQFDQVVVCREQAQAMAKLLARYSTGMGALAEHLPTAQELGFVPADEVAPETLGDSPTPSPTAPSEPSPPATTTPTGKPAESADRGEPKAMTKAKELADANGIDWRELFPGSGKGGMVRQDDVQRAIKARKNARRAEGLALLGGKGNGAAAPKKAAAKELTFTDVRQRLAELVQKKGKPAAHQLLGKYGVEKVSALTEEQWPEVMDALAEALA